MLDGANYEGLAPHGQTSLELRIDDIYNAERSTIGGFADQYDTAKSNTIRQANWEARC